MKKDVSKIDLTKEPNECRVKRVAKETKLKELERRIEQLEKIQPTFYPPHKPNDFMSTNQKQFYCQFCGGFVYACPGHTISD